MIDEFNITCGSVQKKKKQQKTNIFILSTAVNYALKRAIKYSGVCKNDWRPLTTSHFLNYRFPMKINEEAEKQAYMYCI